MARPVYRQLPLLFVACLLFQISECSRPSSSSPADRVDELHHDHQLQLLDAGARTARPTSTEVAGDGRTSADDAATAPWSAPATPRSQPSQAVGAVTSQPRRTRERALVLAGLGARPVVLLRSKPARRFLAGAGVDEAASATDGAAGASCHSNNPHIGCPPAGKP